MLNRATKLLLYGGTLWYLGEGMLGPLFAVFAGRIGGSILDISWAWALYLIVEGILYLIFGMVSDRKLSMKKLMIAGYALNALFTFGYVFVDTPLKLFVVQALLGVAAAMASPTWSALYSKYMEHEHSGSHWGLAGGYQCIVCGIAIILGGLVVNYISFTALFVTMGVIQVIATVYQAQILRE